MKCFAIELFINESQDILTCIVPCSDSVIHFFAIYGLQITFKNLAQNVGNGVPETLEKKIYQGSIDPGLPRKLVPSALPEDHVGIFAPPKPRTWLRH